MTEGPDQKYTEGFRLHLKSYKKLLKALGGRETWSGILYSYWELFFCLNIE